MKRVLLSSIFILFLGFGFSYAQTLETPEKEKPSETTEYVTDSNVEKLVDKYTGKIEAAIVSLAQSLKQPAEHVYKILVKQQYVKAAIGLFIFLVTLILIVLGINYGKNVDNWDRGSVYPGKHSASPGLCVIFGIAGLIFLLIFFACGYFTDVIQGFINPEYGAIEDIIKLIK